MATWEAKYQPIYMPHCIFASTQTQRLITWDCVGWYGDSGCNCRVVPVVFLSSLNLSSPSAGYSCSSSSAGRFLLSDLLYSNLAAISRASACVSAITDPSQKLRPFPSKGGPTCMKTSTGTVAKGSSEPTSLFPASQSDPLS